MSGLFSAQRFKPRCQALLVHLAIGVVILAPLTYIVMVLWYPGHLFYIDGGLEGMYLLLAVDLAIGPGLTFLVYDVAKSKGKIYFDLVVIALLKIAALTWGVHTIASQRPIVLTFYENRFASVHRLPLEQQDTTPEEIYARFPGPRPPAVYALEPADKQDFALAFLRTLNEGLDISQQVDRMRPVAEHLEKLRAGAVDADPAKTSAELTAAVKVIAAELDRSPEDLIVNHFSGRYGDGLAVFDQHGNYLGIYPATP